MRPDTCPKCRSTREQMGEPAALACDGPFHQGELGRVGYGHGVVPLPAGLCRCTPCCCKPGEGHHTEVWKVYEREQRAYERYQDALASGLSDAEAREEGWPSHSSGRAR